MILKTLKVFLPILLILKQTEAFDYTGSTRHPIILVPGDGGNQLYAKLNKVR
jgi:hypothetical protein